MPTLGVSRERLRCKGQGSHNWVTLRQHVQNHIKGLNFAYKVRGSEVKGSGRQGSGLDLRIRCSYILWRILLHTHLFTYHPSTSKGLTSLTRWVRGQGDKLFNHTSYCTQLHLLWHIPPHTSYHTLYNKHLFLISTHCHSLTCLLAYLLTRWS